MKLLKYLIALSFCFAGTAIAAKSKTKAAQKDEPILVQSVTGESSETISLITLTLNKALKDKKAATLSEHGRYLQLDINGVSAAKPGSFYEANSPYLNKIALFETGKQSTAIRIFTEEDTAVIKKVTEVDVLENRIILSLDHKALKSLLSGTVNSKTADNFMDQLEKMSASATTKKEDGQAKELTAEAPVTKTPEQIKSSLTEIGVGKTSLDLSKNLRKVAFFLAGMFVLLMLALTFKRFKRNAFLAQKSGEDALKTLGTLTLNPKQQLNLVEVGGEKILLSVSNDAVSLISHIGQKAAAEGPLLPPAQSSQKTQAQKLLGSSTASTQKGFPETLKALRKKAAEIEKSKEKPAAAQTTRFTEALEKGDCFKPARKNVASQTAAKKGGKVNVAITDDGVSKVSSAPKKTEQDEAIKDVTSLIRQKLKDLPKF